jgi:hypothetical protein
MRTLVLLSLVLTSPLLLNAALVPGTERSVTATTNDVAAFNQTAARIATDGDRFLAVWLQTNLGSVGDIHGALVSAEGKRLSDDVLIIANADIDERRPAVAFGADQYLVVWTTASAVRGRFIARDGVMSPTFEIGTPNAVTQIQIAYTNSRFLIVYDTPSLGGFRGVLVDTNGTIMRTFVAASASATTPYTALVAANGAFHFFTAIADFNGVPNGNGYPSDVGMTDIDIEGNVSPRVVIAPATTPVFDLSATTKGNEMFVGWTTAIGIPGGTVRNVRIAPGGNSAIDVIPAENAYLHDVVADASGFLVIYGNAATKYQRRPGATEPLSLIATPAGQTAILDSANNGQRTVVIVRGAATAGFDDGPAGADLYVTRLDRMEIEPLVVSPRHQSSPDVAAAGDLRLAAWCEYIGSERRLGIIAQRLDANGEALAATGIDLHASVFHPEMPRVASNGTDWLVTWHDAGFQTLYGSRVRQNGTLVDATPFVIATGLYASSDVSVGWDGTQYVVTYIRGQFLRGLQSIIHVSLVPPAGTTITSLPLHADVGANEFPSVAGNGNGSLIVWRSGTTLRGVMLSTSGNVTPLAFAGTPPMWPASAVAWNGTTYIVAAPLAGPTGSEVQWFLVSAGGTITQPAAAFPHIDANPIYLGGYPFIDVEADATGFLLYFHGVGIEPSVYAARIGADGQLVDAPAVVGTTRGDYHPTFGAAGNIVVYARKIGHTTGELTRVFARTVTHVQGQPRRRAARH